MSNGVTKSVVIVMALTIISKILGFFREGALAFVFGANSETDIYFIVFSAVTLLIGFIANVTNIVYIPAYAKCSNKKEQVTIFTTSMFACAIVSMFICIVGELSSGFLENYLPMSYSIEKQHLFVSVIRTMLPAVFFMGINGIYIATYQLHNEYFFSTSSTIYYNIVVIVAILWSGQYWGLTGAALGVSIGFLIQSLILTAGICRLPINLSLHPYSFLRNMRVLTLPPNICKAIIGTAVVQLLPIVDLAVGLVLHDGAISYVKYAERVLILVTALFGDALISVFYPRIAASFSNGETREMVSLTKLGMRYIISILTPMMLLYVIASDEIIILIFQRGNFTSQMSSATSEALKYYAFGMIPFVLCQLLTRVFYAMHNINIPMVISAVHLLVYGLFVVSFIPQFAFLAIPIAFTLSNCLKLVALFCLVSNRKRILDSNILKLAKINIVASAVALFIIKFVDYTGIIQLSLPLFRLIVDSLIVLLLFVIVHSIYASDEYMIIKRTLLSLIRQVSGYNAPTRNN